MHGCSQLGGLRPPARVALSHMPFAHKFCAADVTGAKVLGALQAGKEWSARAQTQVAALKAARSDEAAFTAEAAKAAELLKEGRGLRVRMDADCDALQARRRLGRGARRGRRLQGAGARHRLGAEGACGTRGLQARQGAAGRARRLTQAVHSAGTAGALQAVLPVQEAQGRGQPHGRLRLLQGTHSPHPRPCASNRSRPLLSPAWRRAPRGGREVPTAPLATLRAVPLASSRAHKVLPVPCRSCTTMPAWASRLPAPTAPVTTRRPSSAARCAACGCGPPLLLTSLPLLPAAAAAWPSSALCMQRSGGAGPAAPCATLCLRSRPLQRSLCLLLSAVLPCLPPFPPLSFLFLPPRWASSTPTSTPCPRPAWGR